MNAVKITLLAVVVLLALVLGGCGGQEGSASAWQQQSGNLVWRQTATGFYHPDVAHLYYSQGK